MATPKKLSRKEELAKLIAERDHNVKHYFIKLKTKEYVKDYLKKIDEDATTFEANYFKCEKKIKIASKKKAKIFPPLNMALGSFAFFSYLAFIFVCFTLIISSCS